MAEPTIGAVLEVTRIVESGVNITEIKVDLGVGENRRVRSVYYPCGDDSAPLPGDLAIFLRMRSTGRLECVGFIDPNNAQITLNGEKRIYARDTGGAIVVDLHLKRDSSIRAENANGSYELRADGVVVVNDVVTIDPAGNIYTPGTIDADGRIESQTSLVAPSVVADGKELVDHDHNINSGSSAPGPTGPNN